MRCSSCRTSSKLDRGRRGELGASGKAHDADLVRIDVPFLRMRADHADRLLRVVDRVGLRVVAVAPQTIAQNDRIDAVVVEERNEVRALESRRSACCGRRRARRITAAPVLMPGSTTCTSIDGLWMLTMLWMRPGTPFCMLFCSGFADTIACEERGTGRKERDDLSAWQDRLRDEAAALDR